MLVVCSSALEAENFYDDLNFFSAKSAPRRHFASGCIFSFLGVLPFENLSPHPDNIAGRLEGLYKLVEESAPILIATPAALMQKVIAKEALKQSYLYLVAGQDLRRDSLLEHLVQWGFKMCRWSRSAATSACAAGIVDVFSPGYGRPLRLEFDGDRLESIREFNPATQRTAQLQEEMLLLPMKDFSLKQSGVENALRRLDQRAWSWKWIDERRTVCSSRCARAFPFPGIEFLAPYFAGTLVPVFSLPAPKRRSIWLDGADRVEARPNVLAD